MEITLNDDVLRFLIDESRHRFTRHEAFESLFSIIKEAEEGVLRTSFNRLSKVWNWDNHQVSDFIGKLMEIGVLAVEREGGTVVLRFTEGFEGEYQRLFSLFSLLSMKVRKADKLEAFFLVVGRLSEHAEDVRLSYRELAKELGWSHHTVSRLVDLMVRNSIISKEPFKEERKTRRLVSQNII